MAIACIFLYLSAFGLLVSRACATQVQGTNGTYNLASSCQEGYDAHVENAWRDRQR
jgi:hypothetical protein